MSAIDRIREDFMGLSATTPIVGGMARRIYLDSTATSLMPRSVHAVVAAYLEGCCANSHTMASLSGRSTTAAIEQTRSLIGNLVGADDSYEVIFVGNGATGALNRLASAISRQPRAGRNVIVTTEMEHHSNILPWIRTSGIENVRFVRINEDGTLDMNHLREILIADGRRTRLVSVTAVSNVTGIINPIYQIAELAHSVGAEISVDGAQAVPHLKIQMLGQNRDMSLDYLAFSGHKLYAPGSPGVLVAKKSTFPSDDVVGDVGGGAVKYVGADGVRWEDRVCHREEAGTPNIPGIISLGAAVTLMNVVGIDNIVCHEDVLVRHAFDRLGRVPQSVIYGPMEKRAGVVSFNVGEVPHGLLASALSDYFGIAVRNECFCAQPYVRRQIAINCQKTGENGPCLVGPGARGMVRASFGMFTTSDDIDRLAVAAGWIHENYPSLHEQYEQVGSGFSHKTFSPEDVFDVSRELARSLVSRIR